MSSNEYKLIVLAPSAGGKSALFHYLEEDSNLVVAETDDEVMKANNITWPDNNDFKDKVLVPQVMHNIMAMPKIIFFASYVPTGLLKQAKTKGFRVVLLETPRQVLEQRNTDRMAVEDYADVSQWFDIQLDGFAKLDAAGIVDTKLNGDQPLEQLARSIIELTK